MTNMEPIILFRGSLAEEGELESAQKFFDVKTQRASCKDAFIIPRYSYLPFAKELEEDLIINGCSVINSYKQHRWIANFEYYGALEAFTPKTWDEYTFQDCVDPGPFCVKGKTNSRKFSWKRLMFAKDKKEAVHIGCELLEDSMIGEQEIIYRKYIPLKTFEIGINGLPFSNEWRFFFLGEKMLSYGYYWSCAEKASEYQITDEGIAFAQKIAKIAAEHVNFFVLDIAETVEGEWILIEVNDGCQSGLSMNDPDVLYSNLKQSLEYNKWHDYIMNNLDLSKYLKKWVEDLQFENKYGGIVPKTKDF